MAWNGQVPTEANWSGNAQFAGDEVLYTTPNPANITTDPSIGIVDGNLIPLPTSYNTLNTTNLNTQTINGNPVPISAEQWSLYPAIHDVIADQQNAPAYTPFTVYLAGNLASVGDTDYTCILSGETLAPPSLLDEWNPAFPYVPNASYGATYNGVFYIATQNNTNVVPTSSLGVDWRLAEWSSTYAYSTGDLVFVTSTGLWYKANGANTNVSPLDPPPLPPLPAVWSQTLFWTTADYVNPIYNIKGFDDIQSASVHTLVADAYELNVALNTTLGSGADALTVNGGTVLDGGLLHGTTIGSLPVSGINTVRVDVLPVGIDLTSATYIAGVAVGAITWDAGGAANLAAGGALSLAGGSYIEYNSDQHYFRNTSAGNDFTDIYVGNIHPADGGSAPLRINDDGTGRGVQIDDGTTWNTQNINVSNEAIAANLIALEATAGNFNTLSYVNIPESQNLPTDWSGAATYDLYALVIYTPTGVLYFNTIADNQGNSPFKPAWDGGTTYDLNDFVTDAGISYRSLQASNTGNTPASSPLFWVVQDNGWLLAEWDVATTYSLNYPTYEPATKSFWISLENANTGNFPSIPANWDLPTTYALDDEVKYGLLHYKSLQNGNQGHYPDEEIPTPLGWDNGTTYALDDLVSYGGLIYKSLQAANTGNLPDDIGSVWWVEVQIFWWEQITIYWSPTQNYFLGNTDTGVVFTPLVAGFTGITTLVKRYGDPDQELNVIVKNPFNVEISAASVVVSPMYKDFDMNGYNITNANISFGDLTVNNLTVNNDLNIHDVYDSVGGNIQFHSNADWDTNVVYAGAVSAPNLYANEIAEQSGGSNIKFLNLVDLNSNDLINATNITASGNLAITSSSGTITIGGSSVVISPELNKNGTGIVACPSMTSNGGLILTALSGNLETGATGFTDIATGGALTLNSTSSTATLSANQDVGITSATSYITLTAGTGQDIQAHSRVDMSSNNIVNCPQITGAGTITVASGGTNTNVALTPNGTGLIVAAKGLNMSSNPITNLTTINGRNIFQYGRFYNSATQTLGATNTATRVVMNSGTGLGVSLDTSTNPGRITVAKNGTYLISWDGYFNHGSGSATTSSIWIRLNASSNVAGTGKRQKCDTSVNDLSISGSAQVTITTSDYLEFVWAADGTNVPLTAVAASSPYPATPSFSCSISIIA